MDVDDCNGQSNISGSADFITDIYIYIFIFYIFLVYIQHIFFSFFLQLVETLQWKESFLGASGAQQ